MISDKSSRASSSELRACQVTEVEEAQTWGDGAGDEFSVRVFGLEFGLFLFLGSLMHTLTSIRFRRRPKV